MKIVASKRIAYIHNNKYYSFIDFVNCVNIFSKLLPKEKMVAILMENRPEWSFAAYATLKQRSIIIPVDYMASKEEIYEILKNASFVFYSNKTEEIFNSIQSLREADKIDSNEELKDLESLNVDTLELNPKGRKDDLFLSDAELKEIKENYDKTIEILSNRNKEQEENEKHLISENSTLNNEQDNIEKSVIDLSFDMDKDAILIYTSGTSSKPLGVRLTKRNLMSNVNDLLIVSDIKNGKRFYTFIPMFHSAGLMAMVFLAPIAQATLLLSDTIVPEQILSNIRDNRINIFGVVPRFAELLHRRVTLQIEKNIFSKALFKLARLLPIYIRKRIFKKVHSIFGEDFEYFISGGALLEVNIERDLETLGFVVAQGYGLTEASPTITYSSQYIKRLGSVGKILPSVSVKIVDDEIVVKGDNVFQGYHNNPEKTKEVLIDGWLYTGDLGYIKDDFLFINGRKKDIIVSSTGKNIWPQKIEEKIFSTSEIFEEVALISNNGKLELLVRANLKYAKANSIANIEYFVKDKIADYNIKADEKEKIDHIHLVDTEFPKTRLGKLKRYMLKDLSFVKEKVFSTDEPKDDLYIKLKEQLLLISDQVFPDSHIELDLGLGSMEKLQLIYFIEHDLNCKINMSTLAKNPTVRELFHLIKQLQEERKEELKKELFTTSANTISEKDEINNNSSETNAIPIPKTSILHKCIAKLVQLIFRIKKRETLPKGAAVLVANHLSMIDWYLISAALGEDINSTFCWGKDKLIKSQFSRAFAKKSNVILFNINANLSDSIEYLSYLLKQGKKVVIFPEGTRSRTGKLNSFHLTFVTLAKACKVPVIPVVIKGSDKILPPGTLIPRLRKAEVKFLKAIGYEEDMILEKAYSAIQEALS